MLNKEEKKKLAKTAKMLLEDLKPKTPQESLDWMRENFNILLESQGMLVVLTRARYVALTKSGFTDEQALELCKL